jgi:type IV pilus assembly protein PilY1
MEMDAINGARLETSPFDVDGDGDIDEYDLVQLLDTNNDGIIDDRDNHIAVSGLRNREVGIIKTPGVVKVDNNKELKYVSGSSGDLGSFVESSGDPSGRQSWRQIK